MALLDANVLLALAWPNHIHHEAAHQWFAGRRPQGWATCPLTQLAFVRLSSQPAVVTTIPVPDALAALETNTSAAEHEFWPIDYELSRLLPEIRERLMGHHQLTDALLLDLAIRKKGKLATFDRRLENLLAADSAHGSALEILPV